MTLNENQTLAGIRILDLTDPKGHYMGRLLADLGADVIKIETPSGDLGRRYGPFIGDDPNSNNSLFWSYYNAGKRSIAIDIKQPDGADLVRSLSVTTQVILESLEPGELSKSELDYSSLVKIRKCDDLVMTSLTPFGQDGPRANWAWSDAVGLALGGPMSSCGYDNIPGTPPIRPTEHHSLHIGGHYGVIGTLLAILHRESTGIGQHVDVSIHEACACTTEAAIPYALLHSKSLIRQTGRHASASPTEPWQYPAADGRHILIYGTTRNDRDWNRLVDWAEEKVGVEGLRDPELSDPRKRQLGSGHEATNRMLASLAKLASTLSAEAAYHGGQDHGAAWGAIRAPEENLSDPHWKDRDFFITKPHGPNGTDITYPGAPYKMSATPWKIGSRAPRIGEHTAAILIKDLQLSAHEITTLIGAGIIA